ncbi:MAG: DUF4160 domain-containing protein [Spirochaetota bacterium]|nr:DUF4160 domain-containing protein [Spirochaetota bacterium]
MISNKYTGINDFALLDGYMPPKILGLVVEWTAKYCDELNEDWKRAQNKEELLKIDPLE